MGSQTLRLRGLFHNEKDASESTKSTTYAQMSVSFIGCFLRPRQTFKCNKGRKKRRKKKGIEEEEESHRSNTTIDIIRVIEFESSQNKRSEAAFQK